MKSDQQFLEMDDGVRLRTWSGGRAVADTTPLVLIHGGPGLPDYLEPVAEMAADLHRVHRYDQRGTGGSPWGGDHTIARQVRDLELLLGAWGYERVVLVGHSFGADLACFFLLAHPDRVAGVIFLSGPFLGPWREPTRAVERSRRSPRQQARLDELAGTTARSDAEEVEFLTLSWFTDHADPVHGWAWASAAAQTRRPINYEMNAQLNVDKRVAPLESQIEQLRTLLPSSTVIIGGAGDPRPASFLRPLGKRLGCDVTVIPDAGHEPWLEKPAEFATAFRAAIQQLPG